MFLKYRKVTDILPAELVDKIQDYIQGEYIYIPRREKKTDGNVTAYQRELQKRDANIYLKVLEGMSKKELAEKYNLSQSSIRRIVLTQRKEYVEMQKKIEVLLKEWGIGEVSVSQVYDSAWQIGENYILKIYDNVEEPERNITMSQLLREKGVPVAEVVSTLKNEKYVLRENVTCVLTKKLPGNNIVEFDKNFSQAKELGIALGKLHLALAEIGETEEFWENSLLAEVKGWIREVFEKRDWIDFSKEEFDLSQKNIRIFDICYFLLGLLCEEEKRVIPFEEWMKIGKQVFAGYAEHISLSEEEIKAVPYVMEAIELLFVAWFIQCEDDICARDALRLYEFVKQHENEIRNISSVTKSLQF